MKDQRLKVKRGSRLDLHIGPDGRGGMAKAAPDARTRRPAITDGEDSPYVFRPRATTAFYDLGTRLVTPAKGYAFTGLEYRGMGEDPPEHNSDDLMGYYSELKYEVEGSSLIGLESDTFLPPIQLSDLDLLRMERLLMGSLAPEVEGEPEDETDPLGFTAANTGDFGEAPKSNRKLAHCMPLFFGNTTDQLSAEIGQVFPLKINGTNLTTLLADGRATVRDSRESDPTEDWGDGDDPASGRSFKQLGLSKEYKASLVGGPIQITSVAGTGFYYSFDTSDTVNIKITNKPDPEQDEVEYKYNGRDSFYLRPEMGGIFRDKVATGPVLFGVRVVASWVSRRYTAIGTVIPSALNVASFPDRNWIRRSEYSRYPEFSGGSVGRGFVSFTVASEGVTDELPRNGLVAIIASPGRRFYLWRKRA